MYTVHPSIAHMHAILDNLPVTTGKSLQEWMAILAKTEITSEQLMSSWLKKNYGLGQTTATVLAQSALDAALGNMVSNYLSLAPAYVDALYAGPKKSLRPLHDTLIQVVLSLYPEVSISPCKTFVPLYRNHVIAQIKPATRERIDFGLALKHYNGTYDDCLIDTGGSAKGDRITHKIALSSVNDINATLKTWLHRAYELDA